MGNLGPWEIALIVLVILLLFGAKKLPEIGRSMGRGIREFKDTVGDTAKELKDATAETPMSFKDGLNPKQSLKNAVNPFYEEEQQDEVLDGEIVDPGQPAAQPAATQTAPQTAPAEAPAAAPPPAGDPPHDAEPADAERVAAERN
jgi:sec-independent protein translocase protein TatA